MQQVPEDLTIKQDYICSYKQPWILHDLLLKEELSTTQEAPEHPEKEGKI